MDCGYFVMMYIDQVLVNLGELMATHMPANSTPREYYTGLLEARHTSSNDLYSSLLTGKTSSSTRREGLLPFGRSPPHSPKELDSLSPNGDPYQMHGKPEERIEGEAGPTSSPRSVPPGRYGEPIPLIDQFCQSSDLETMGQGLQRMMTAWKRRSAELVGDNNAEVQEEAEVPFSKDDLDLLRMIAAAPDDAGPLFQGLSTSARKLDRLSEDLLAQADSANAVMKERHTKLESKKRKLADAWDQAEYALERLYHAHTKKRDAQQHAQEQLLRVERLRVDHQQVAKRVTGFVAKVREVQDLAKDTDG